MRNLTVALVGIAFIAYAVAFGREGIGAILLFLPFTMTPFAIIAYLAARWDSRGSQVVFLLSTVAYGAWFVYLYVDATILNLDPQSPIVFLFVGIYAAPVLFLLWWIAYAFEWHHRTSLTRRCS